MKQPINTDTLTVNVQGCARCGAHHEGIEFKRLQLPMIDNDGTQWDWWALCPYNQEPILLRKTENELK